MRATLPYLTAFLSLVLAMILGGPLGSFETPAGNPLQPVEDGFDSIRQILADVLYLKLDEYHHIMMFQGYEWTQISDYLPQIWLIVKLKPDFVRAYEDGAYHIAVNLGDPERGLELLEEGLSNCPGDSTLLWQNMVIRWRTDFGTPEGRLLACLQFARVMRERVPPDPSPSQMRNCYLVASWIIEDSAGEAVLLSHYSRRAGTLDLIIETFRSRPS